jgi:hypothetical protein
VRSSMIKVASYGRVISPSTSPLGTVMICAKTFMQTGRQMPTKTGVQINAVLLCLQAIERISYCMPNFSSLKIALCEHNLDVARVSERHATFNQMDVVRRIWYQSNFYLFLLLYMCFLIFFVCPLTEFTLWFHLCYKWHVAYSHASYWVTGVRLGLRGRPRPEDDNWYSVLREIYAELGHE